MTYYLFLSDRNGAGSGSRWALMGMTVKVAQSVSAHLTLQLQLYLPFHCSQIGLRESLRLFHALPDSLTIFGRSG